MIDALDAQRVFVVVGFGMRRALDVVPGHYRAAQFACFATDGSRDLVRHWIFQVALDPFGTKQVLSAVQRDLVRR